MMHVILDKDELHMFYSVLDATDYAHPEPLVLDRILKGLFDTACRYSWANARAMEYADNVAVHNPQTVVLENITWDIL